VKRFCLLLALFIVLCAVGAYSQWEQPSGGGGTSSFPASVTLGTYCLSTDIIQVPNAVTGATDCVAGVRANGTGYGDWAVGANTVTAVQSALLTPGSNLILNGDGSGATDWTGATGATPPTSWTVVNAGTFTITASGQQSTNYLSIGYSATNPTITQGFTTISGHVYSLTYYFQKGTSVSGSVYLGTTSGASDLYNSGALIDATWGLHATTFTAQGTTTYISLVNTCTSTGTSGFDSFNLTEISSPLELISPQAASISAVANQLTGNYVFTNTGAAGAVIVTLPAGGVNNYSAEFEVAAGQYLEALASGSDTFKYYQTSGAAGGYVRSNVIGTRWKVTWNGSAWSIHDLVGALNYDQ